MLSAHYSLPKVCGAIQHLSTETNHKTRQLRLSSSMKLLQEPEHSRTGVIREYESAEKGHFLIFHWTSSLRGSSQTECTNPVSRSTPSLTAVPLVNRRCNVSYNEVFFLLTASQSVLMFLMESGRMAEVAVMSFQKYTRNGLTFSPKGRQFIYLTVCVYPN